MEYSNPEIPEGINTTKTHPLKEFAILTGGVLGIIILAVFILSLLAEKLAVYVPFSVEQQLVPAFFIEEEMNSNTDSDINIYLQDLSAQIAARMDIPDEMTMTIHYVDDDVENAFATVGGHIFIYRDLLRLLPNENALSMVLAHEMAHVLHRHPIMAMGRGVVIGLLLATISGLSADHFVGGVISNTGTITMLGFSREQERAADETALAVVARHYGHVGGAEDLFRTLLALEEKYAAGRPQFLSTHPLSENRIHLIHQYARSSGLQTQGQLTELPAIIKHIGDKTE
jgi:predicted Zn-dependent protease